MPDSTTTTATLPGEDDWEGWADILTRPDTGRVDCVPACLLHLVEGIVGSDGRNASPGLIPSTPYGVAKFMLMGHPLPWRGTGLTPETVQALLRQGVPCWAIKAAASEEADHEEAVGQSPARPELSFADLYMIRSADGPIKIGISADPEKRLKALQTGHAYRLEIACIVPGGGHMEAVYHARFAEHRLHGEWFSPHPDILAEIERLNSPAFA